MAKERNDDFQYEIKDGFDFIIEETGNGSTNLRKISWNGRPHKLDIRKYTFTNGQERMMKGISLSEEGGHILTNVLVEQGYGDTNIIEAAIKKRPDYGKEKEVKKVEDDISEEEYYDPKLLLAPMGENEDE